MITYQLAKDNVAIVFHDGAATDVRVWRNGLDYLVGIERSEGELLPLTSGGCFRNKADAHRAVQSVAARPIYVDGFLYPTVSCHRPMCHNFYQVHNAA